MIERIAFALVLIVMLVAGLAPGEYRFRNEVQWIKGGNGLRFERYGIVHTPAFLTVDTARSLNQSGATLMLRLMLPADKPQRFQFIASFHNGDDGSQLVVAQWQEELIVMNGNDYSYARRMPRVSADLSSHLNRPVLLAISTSPSGTWIAVDGQIVGHDPNVQVLMPAGVRSSLLALGNSVRSNHGWTGSLLGFALLSRPLTVAQLQDHAFDLGSVRPEDTIQLLHFGEQSGHVVRDFSGGHHDALVPARLTPLENNLLSDDSSSSLLSKSGLSDMALNLIGFMPFGLLLAALVSSRGVRTRHVIIGVTLCSFALSFGIEAIQTWIPTRSSSALDLLLNTLGGAIGAAGGRRLWRGA